MFAWNYYLVNYVYRICFGYVRWEKLNYRRRERERERTVLRAYHANQIWVLYIYSTMAHLAKQNFWLCTCLCVCVREFPQS